MTIGGNQWRRTLGRALTRQSSASVDMILANPPRVSGSSLRIGVTGHPGAGKSSLIAKLAAHRLRRGRDVAVLAIDPTSPISDGSLLGDRIRMDAVADDDRLYIRSASSGTCEDGLCHNIVGLLDTLDSAGFDDILLETVGTGQSNYRARVLVDLLVLTLAPESGDMIQAMKAGIMEVADIYVINKADLPGAAKLAAEVGTLLLRFRSVGGWRPPIILASIRDDRGVADLDRAIETYLETRSAGSPEERDRSRRAYQLKALLEWRLKEVLDEALRAAGSEIQLERTYDRVVAMLERDGLGRSTADCS
jgi:LAO/AO transport system kinase